MATTKEAMARFRADPDDQRHGTVTGYRYGCRCERCARAYRERGRAYRAAHPRNGGMPRAYTDGGAWEMEYRDWQRKRALELLAKPYPLTDRQIAERVGVTPGTVGLWRRRAS